MMQKIILAIKLLAADLNEQEYKILVVVVVILIAAIIFANSFEESPKQKIKLDDHEQKLG